MNSLFLLAWEYFKIGAIAIGGGYTVIPFLYYLVEKYGWFDISEITGMIAISNLTPGPIGINMATFVGIKVGGVLGAALTTVSFMIPSFIIICFLAGVLKKNGENKCINNILYGLRPAAVALIGVAGLKIMNTTVFHLSQHCVSLKSLLLLCLFGIIGLKLKKNPMILIIIAILIGLVLRV